MSRRDGSKKAQRGNPIFHAHKVNTKFDLLANDLLKLKRELIDNLNKTQEGGETNGME